MEVIQTGNFSLPLDTEEAKEHINDRRETLVKVFTEGFSALQYLIECGSKTYGEATPLCLIPYKDGTFEIAPVYKTGVHLPTCLVGINFLWSKHKSSKKEFVRQATLLSNRWLVSYAAYISSRLQPSTDLPVWQAVMLEESVKERVDKYYAEEDSKVRAAELLKANRLLCGICETMKSENGVCCNNCHSWGHISCAATSVAEKLDTSDVGTSTEKDLTDPGIYVCSSCK